MREEYHFRSEHLFECECGKRNGFWPWVGSARAAHHRESPARDGIKNGQSWVYVKLYVEVSDGEDNGLRGRGHISSDGRMEVRFSHNADRLRRGEWQANGDVVWDVSGLVWTYASEEEQRWSVLGVTWEHDAAAD